MGPLSCLFGDGVAEDGLVDKFVTCVDSLYNLVSPPATKIADAADCSKPSVFAMTLNLRYSGSTKTLSNVNGLFLNVSRGI